jgi:hypothetical protein
MIIFQFYLTEYNQVHRGADSRIGTRNNKFVRNAGKIVPVLVKLHTRKGSRGSVVGIATGYGLNDCESEFESLWCQEFLLLHVVQTGSWFHPTSYPMVTVGSFPGGKVAGACSWPLTYN